MSSSPNPSFSRHQVIVGGPHGIRNAGLAVSQCLAVAVLELEDPAAGAADDLKAATATVAAEVIWAAADLEAAGLAKLALHGARAITFTTAGVTPADAPASVDIVGEDIEGNALSETLVLSQIAGAVTSAKCYSDITTLTFPAADGTGATIAVGIADKFGLPAEIKTRGSVPVYLLEMADGDIVSTGGASTTATNQAATATSQAVAHSGCCRYVNPIAEEVVSIVANVAMADGAQILAGQPDYPRKLRVDITDGDASVTAGIVTIVGVGADGSALSEAVDLTGGTAVKVTDDAFATVTSATISALAGETGADLIGIGVDSALGLPIPAAATSVAVNKTIVDSADETVAGVDTTARTVDPTSAPDAAKDFDFYFSYELTTVQDSHNHTQDAHAHGGSEATMATATASAPYGAYTPSTTPDGSIDFLLLYEQVGRSSYGA
jgi:hypothetical protein